MKKLKLKKRYWFLLFLLAIGIFVSVKFIQHNLAVKTERAAFESSYAEVVRRADRLSAIYRPDERKESKSCDYSSAKFSRGSLGCSVSQTMIYKNISVEKANEIMKKNASFNPGELLYPHSTGTIRDVPYFYKLSKDEKDNKVRQSINQDFQGSTPYCGVSYTYISVINAAKEPVGLKVYLGCSSNALSEHYPIKE